MTNAASVSSWLLGAFLVTASPAATRDAGLTPGRWWDGFHAPGVQIQTSFPATVTSMVTYRGDLILAGDFVSAGSLQTNGLVRWDGQRVSRLGDGPGRSVHALVVHGDALVAAGTFAATPQAPAHDLARWDGQRWMPMMLAGGRLRGSITAMTVDGGGNLVVAGRQLDPAGTLTTRVAIWDGHDWRLVGGDFRSERGSAGVNAVTMFQGELVAAGRFDRAGGVAAANIARWDGQSWRPLGAGVKGDVIKLGVHAGSLIVNGRFKEVGDLLAQCVAAWDGTSWTALGAGLKMTFEFGDVLSTGRDLLVSGWFDLDNDTKLGIARWNGSAWRFDRAENRFGSDNILALALYDGSLVAGGNFDVAHGRYMGSVARVEGSAWEPLLGGSGFSIREGYDPYTPSAMTTWNGDLIVAHKRWGFAGGQNVPSLAQWDGTSWHPFGGVIDGDVAELLSYHGELIAAGDFASAGGVVANGIASWNGTRWAPFGAGFSPPGKVQALTVYHDQLIAGGFFNASGGRPVFSVARWDGNAWQPFADGLYWDVRDLAVYNDELIAAGAFTTDGHASVRYIARWDGSAWRSLGSFPNGIVSRLAVYDGGLVAAGGHVTVWNGATWRPMPGFGGTITDLTIHDGKLTAAGWLNLAAWDGSRWQRMGTAMGNSPMRLCSSDGSLFVLGGFYGFQGVLSSGIARWDANVVLDSAANAPEAIASIQVDRRTRLIQGAETRRGAHFTYSLAGSAAAEISIYDVRGRLMCALPLEPTPGRHDLTWDRQDRSGRRVARGVYFARLTSGPEHDVRKLVLLAD